LEDEENEQYEVAILEYKQVIELFPESEYVELSLKALLRIAAIQEGGEERSGELMTLKAYCDSTTVLHANPRIDFFTNSIANYCDVLVGNYEPAIDWYESVMENPPTIADSINSAIDIGMVYLLMDAGGQRTYTGERIDLIPESFEDWQSKRNALLEQLWMLEENGAQDICSELRANNYPNPFNPETTISFSLPADSEVKLSVYNIRGQLVKRVIDDQLERGSHSIIWNGRNSNNQSCASGVYFYRLEACGKTQTRKMMLLK